MHTTSSSGACLYTHYMELKEVGCHFWQAFVRGCEEYDLIKIVCGFGPGALRLIFDVHFGNYVSLSCTLYTLCRISHAGSAVSCEILRP